MGFDIYWSLHRAHGLDPDERGRVAAHVARWSAVIDGYDLMVSSGPAASDGEVVGWCSLRPSHGDPGRSDQAGYLLTVVDRVLEALAELRTLVPEAELAAADDFGTYGWDAEGWEPNAQDAPEVEFPESRDGWIAASTLPAAPQALPRAAAPLLATDPTAEAIGEALATGVLATGVLAVAGWADALAARLALDAWMPRSWSAEVIQTIAEIGGRAAWRSVALAADAGLPGAAGALARLVDYNACAVLTASDHPAWLQFADLGGYLVGKTPAGSADGATAAAIRRLNEARDRLLSVGRGEDDDHRRSTAIPAAARAALTAFAAAAAALSLPVEEESQALLAPRRDETIAEIDDAMPVVAAALAERLAGALVGSLAPADRDAWRAVATAVAVAPREPMVEPEAAIPAAPSPPAAVAPPPASSPPVPAVSGLAAGLARLDAAARVATTPPPRPAEFDQVDALLTAMTKLSDTPSDARLTELGLPTSYARGGTSERLEQLERRLAQFDPALVVTRLLARPGQLLDSYELGRVFTVRVECVVADPTLMDALLDVWHGSPAERWRGCAGWPRLVAPIAGRSPVFDHAIDVVAGPDREQSGDRVMAAFDTLGVATGRQEDATAVLIARLHADRGNPYATWRHHAYQALHELRPAIATATAILELTATERVREAGRLLPLIGRDPEVGVAVLERAIDLPDLAVEATRALARCPAANEVGLRLLAHPFWTIRLEAARHIHDDVSRRAHLFAVWKSIDAAGISMPSDERSRDRESKPKGPPVVSPPLPDPVTGLASLCADYRRAALRAVDARHRPADGAALVWADELDRALQRYGHRRAAPEWHTWKTVVPELARGRSARLAWARANPSSLPKVLRQVRDAGAEHVAATWPRPHLVLPAAELAALRAAELPWIERGRALLWGDATDTPLSYL